jgi:hypothetical protein
MLAWTLGSFTEGVCVCVWDGAPVPGADAEADPDPDPEFDVLSLSPMDASDVEECMLLEGWPGGPWPWTCCPWGEGEVGPWP